MKIGVISDTHIPVFTDHIPSVVIEIFRSCDIIVHAGDIVDYSVVEDLGHIAEVKAVRGNMDAPALKKVLPEKLVFEVSGKKIGVVHGRGKGGDLLEWVKGEFKKDVDIIIFGHSHSPCNKSIGGRLFFNPGSATDSVFHTKRTFGVIYINGETVRGEIIDIAG